MRTALERVVLPLRTPFVSAAGNTGVRELLLLTLEDGEGNLGHGEAAPLEHYDGVRLEDCRAALEDCRGLLASSDGTDRDELLEECAHTAVLPQALAAVDLALWDLAGRRTGQPVWRLLGAAGADPVEVNQTIAAADRAGAVAGALAAREAGFSTLKVKVAIGDDAGRVAAIRAAAGPAMNIRLDANGGWSVAEAAAGLRALSATGIELCEEPVHGVDRVAELAGLTDVPLAMDESGSAPGALDRRVCDAVCLKIARCGGISGLLDAARKARATGYEVYLASTLDGPLGIAGALHGAAVIRPDRACGLATLDMFADRSPPLRPRRGRMAAPAGDGLGDGLTGFYGR